VARPGGACGRYRFCFVDFDLRRFCTLVGVCLPILFSFVISLLSLPGSRRFHAVLALLSLICFSAWVLKTFATDGGALPTANPIDFFVFPLATAITLYLTWRLFGGFITLFCILWIVYFFTRGVLPDWTGVLAQVRAPC